jgi:hypothetical protein
MPRRAAPRLAGPALRALAAALSAPLAGRALARIGVRQMGLEGFRRARAHSAEVRAAVGFRVAVPRREPPGE